jgi:hypothetical protein
VLVAASLICLARELEEAGLRACVEGWRSTAGFLAATRGPVRKGGGIVGRDPRPGLGNAPRLGASKAWRLEGLSGGFLALAAAERVRGWTCRWERQRRAWDQ